MLKIENLKKRYKDFTLDCSLELKEGYITGLIGQNGAGKSTTFKAILGLIPFDSGEITIMGKDVKELSPKDKELIGVVLSDSGFSGYLTIKDIAAIQKSLYENFDEKFFMNQVNKFQLPNGEKIKNFSTGMKAKLKLIAAVSHNARLLILDEPTAGLDVIARDELIMILRDFMDVEEGRGILISSHISSDLESLCDDIYMIHNGKIILHEETDVLLGDYAVLKMDDKQYKDIDKSYIIRTMKESFGVSCLTNQRQFYIENYPKVIVERGNIDELILMMIKGDK